MNEETALGWGYLLLFIGIVCGVITWMGFNWGQTYSGTININQASCPVTVDLKSGDWGTYWHKFYCESSFGGINYCEAVDLSPNGQCTAYYSFTKPPDK